MGREEKEMLKAFLNYGLVAAVIVWAGVVAMMAYRLDDSPWRLAFAALAVGGIVTVVAIFKIRRYVDELNKASEQRGKP
jgi:membrane protein implicated in regulation of membrane protease activity